MGEAQSASPVRPWLADHPSQFLLLERAVEDAYGPQMLKELQYRVDATGGVGACKLSRLCY